MDIEVEKGRNLWSDDTKVACAGSSIRFRGVDWDDQVRELKPLTVRIDI